MEAWQTVWRNVGSGGALWASGTEILKYRLDHGRRPQPVDAFDARERCRRGDKGERPRATFLRQVHTREECSDGAVWDGRWLDEPQLPRIATRLSTGVFKEDYRRRPSKPHVLLIDPPEGSTMPVPCRSAAGLLGASLRRLRWLHGRSPRLGFLSGLARGNGWDRIARYGAGEAAFHTAALAHACAGRRVHKTRDRGCWAGGVPWLGLCNGRPDGARERRHGHCVYTSHRTITVDMSKVRADR